VRAVIIGGGVGGLTTAYALAQAGVEPAVFEREPDLRRAQIGGAFTLYSNAMKPLTDLGLAPQVEAAGSVLKRVELRGRNGDVYARRTLDRLERRWGVPTVGSTRTNLHKILTAALGDGVVEMGAQCVGFDADGDGVTAKLADGREIRGDLLVGADGSRSTLRQLAFPQYERRYAGYTVWQGIPEHFEHKRIPEDTLIIWYGRGLRLCMYHVGRGKPYWAALYTTEEGGRDPEGQSKQVVLDLFKGWAEPIEAMIEATPDVAISRMDNYGGVPMDRWGSDRWTLLGDAAHPTTIDVGQGACQAIEDAYTLKQELERQPTVAAALSAYERRRIARTNRVMQTAWRVGWAGQWTNPVLAYLRRRFMGFGWDQHMRLIEKEA
jgi:FAD-dependent urate hydroxylase